MFEMEDVDDFTARDVSGLKNQHLSAVGRARF
jgi:hypothetical protein